MKEAYYFSHDSNARRDPDILKMRSVYGSEGYGWYWMIVEMMRDQTDYKLDMHSRYAFNALALELLCENEKAQYFITDCINEFNLFETDGIYFWSNSLLRRMNKKEKNSELARQSANARWSKKTAPNKGITESKEKKECIDDANALNIDAIKESKVNKKKENKKNYAEFVSMSEPEYQKLIDQYGPILTSDMVSILDNYKGSKGKTYKNDYRAILSWVVAKVQDKNKPGIQIKNEFAFNMLKEAEARERNGNYPVVYGHSEHA